MDNTLFGIPLVLLGFICIGIAVTYNFIWPRPNPGDPPRPPGRHFVLRWGHSLVWVLLALACFIAGPETALVAGALGIAALILYVVFIVTIFLDRQAAANASLAAKREQSDAREKAP
jgi:hypothetical protein